ncbi:type IV secretory system conjugative DNA transfer family protein [Paraglaciecola sp. Hal342]
MPRTNEEEDAFLKAFSEGWELGRKQAKVILDESFSRLENKINGLYEFRFANLTNVVSMPKQRLCMKG